MSYYPSSSQQPYSNQPHPSHSGPSPPNTQNPSFRTSLLTGAPTPPLAGPGFNVTAFGSGGIGGPMIQPGGAPSSQSTESSPMNVDASEGGSAETRREAGGGAQPGGAGADAGGNFDFTKRKKWQQLLLNELSDTVVFALLPLSNGGAKILYASPGVKELLGYDPRDLEQHPLSDYIFEADLPALLSNLHQSILNRTDLSSYHRFVPKSLADKLRRSSSRSSSGSASEDTASGSGSDGSKSGSEGLRLRKKTDPRPVLLELRGHGYWGEEAERMPLPLSVVQGLPLVASPGGGAGERCKCFFLMVKKWPSKTGEMLDSFLEEKMENERLRAELVELMSTGHISRDELEALNIKLDPDSASRTSIPGLPSSYPYPTTHASSSYNPPPTLSHHMSTASSTSSANYDDGLTGGAYDDDDSDPDRRAYVPPKKAAAPAARKPAATGEGGVKKSKKAKKAGKSDVNHVCVTCGRTDSPEWRRGPLGAKTLCNSCGLRWKKTLKAAEGGGASVA
ncbi:hypothetical protein BDY24DRAFT_388407 [Mrakia frigida]|uniref:PAS domain-containing GATA-type transcription factor n=1 Tax=Mrakia frigida TaxID=29902 RepID=UPI003FCBF3FD